MRNEYSRKRGLSERARARFLEGANRMSVIGRLDEQVDEVLIRPLSKKDKQETTKRENENQALREPIEEITEKQDRKRDELPVWLL